MKKKIQIINSLEEFHTGLSTFINSGEYENRVRILPIKNESILDKISKNDIQNRNISILMGKSNTPCIMKEYLKYCEELGIDTSKIVLTQIK